MNVDITNTGDVIDIDFGDYNEITGYKCIHLNKDKISWVGYMSDTCVEVCIENHHHTACYLFTWNGAENTMQVDTVNAVAPTSNDDLHQKLYALL